MEVIESTLLAGPYDWDETLVPRAEFEARVGRARKVIKAQGLAGLIVAGNAPEQGGLCWLTNYVPKMLPSMAFLGADGALQVRCSGRGSMRDAAQRLTWVEGVTTIRNPAVEIEDWAKAEGIRAGARVGVWGADHVPNTFTRSVTAGLIAIGAAAVRMDADLDLLRARKSDVEIGLLDRAARLACLAVKRARARHAEGAGVRSAMLAGERAAYESGAQDVRLLASFEEGGVPRPLEGPCDPRVERLLGCVMVRFAGYWAEQLFTISPEATAADAAQARLVAMLSAVRPGLTLAGLAAAQDGYALHPILVAAQGNGIGLSRVEAPVLTVDEPLCEGQTYVLRVGLRGAGTDNAISSAMFVLRADGPQILGKG